MSDTHLGNSELPDDLAELADDVCDGTLTAERQDRLCRLLLNDEAAQRAYASYLNLHAQLLWRCRAGEFVPARALPRVPCPTPPTRRAPRRYIPWAAASVAAAAAVLIAIGIWYAPHTGEQSRDAGVSIPPKDPPTFVATLAARSPDAEWESRSALMPGASLPGERLSAGTHVLRRGLAEIQLSADARATLSGLSGPTEIELTEGPGVRLNRGQVAVLIGPDTREFVVHTPHADIIDRGTEFAVVVDNLGTLVHVYEGSVEAVLGSGDGTPIPILPKTTLRIFADGTKEPADVSFEQWRFARSCEVAVTDGQDPALGMPRFEPVTLDERHFTRVGDRPLHNPDNTGNNLAELPKGWRTLPDFPIPFQIGDGVVQLASSLPYMADLPKEIEIEVDKKCAALHFLQATGYREVDQTQVGEYVIQYEDGQQALFPIVYGRNTANWWPERATPSSTPSSTRSSTPSSTPPTEPVVAWRGQNEFVKNRGTTLALYAATWANPHPEKRIKSIVMRTSGERGGTVLCCRHS